MSGRLDDWPEVLISTAGDWKPDTRVLRIPTYGARTEGFEPTSSIREGCWYTDSGAAYANAMTSLQVNLEIHFNQVESPSSAGMRC